MQFKDVETLVLKFHGVQEPCNNLLPLTVQAVESGVEINHWVLLSSRFVDLYGVRDQRNPEQELKIQITNEDKEAEVMAEEMLKVF